MVARGAFDVTAADQVPDLPDGRAARGVVMVGNRSDGAMWHRFTAERRDEPDPLDGEYEGLAGYTKKRNILDAAEKLFAEHAARRIKLGSLQVAGATAYRTGKYDALFGK